MLLFSMHHIVCDGWSLAVLVREMGSSTRSKREASPLAELPLQYADYAVWQREWLQGEVWRSRWSTGASNCRTRLRPEAAHGPFAAWCTKASGWRGEVRAGCGSA